jgi:hypothetical protein
MVTFETVAGEAILIRMDTGTYFSLNQVGTDFWQLLDGRATIAQHATAIANKYNTKTDIFAATLVELAKRSANANEQQALADEYDVDIAIVQGHLAELTNTPAGENLDPYASTIAQEYYVPTETVQADLLEVAAELYAEKLVTIV